MNPTQLAAQANQAAQQGQQQYQNDTATSSAAGGQYNSEHAAAGAANSNLQGYTQYMQGAGSGTNLYNSGLSSAEGAIGFDPSVLATAAKNLTQSQNAQAALNTASQSSTGGYGLSGAQLGGYYASQAAPLASQVGAQSTAVGNLTGLLTASQNQASQYAGVGVQGEQATSAALNQVFQNANTQASQSQQQMQYYSTLASTQGSLNAQEQAAYSSAQQAYQQAKLAIAQASQAYAQAGLASSQTAGQNLVNTAAQNKAAYNATPNGHGGYNFFYNGQPITVQQYNAATGNNINPGIGH